MICVAAAAAAALAVVVVPPAAHQSQTVCVHLQSLAAGRQSVRAAGAWSLWQTLKQAAEECDGVGLSRLSGAGRSSADERW